MNNEQALLEVVRRARQVADDLETIEGRTKGDKTRLCDLRAVLRIAIANLDRLNP